MLRKHRLLLITAMTLLGFAACQSKTSQVDSPTLTSQTPPTSIRPSEPLPSEGSLTASQHGITLTVTRLEVSSSQTVIDFISLVDSKWKFTFGQYDSPPQQVFVNQVASLVDETGHSY
jgi:hypothetical protein